MHKLPQFLRTFGFLVVCLVSGTKPPLLAGVGDPQIRTDHPWYPGELAISTFPRLFETQAKVYEHVVGRRPETDQDKALASWLWRNTHFAHAEEGVQDLFSQGFQKGDNKTRDFWTGLFTHGYALCGTTHGQWCAEMNELLGHGRGRCVGVPGHNSFEVFLKGGAYGEGRWALLDHDLSTVIFSDDGSRMLSIAEIKPRLQQLADPNFKPAKQHGWRVSGLHSDDAKAYTDFNTAEYLAGYAGPPPMVHLRRGEKFRRYFQPGLQDGKTFVYWGRNYRAGNIPGPERNRTWVNQPDKMHNATSDTGARTGQVRYGNAEFIYEPDFADDSYREAVVAETDSSVTFEFRSPYLIAATPPDSSDWGIYKHGCQNGLVIDGQGEFPVDLSTDGGTTWTSLGKLAKTIDATDLVKGHLGYQIRFAAGARELANAKLRWTTVCQLNTSVLPRLKDLGTDITYAASGQAIKSVGPTLAQTKSAIVGGSIGSRSVTLQAKTPRGEPIARICAATQVASSNPPNTVVRYQIEVSLDAGKSWQPIVKDWSIPLQGEQPKDFWSQSFCWGSQSITKATADHAQVRFSNDGGKPNLRVEAHVTYEVANQDAMKVTYDWVDAIGDQRESHVFEPGNQEQTWTIPTAKAVITRWVEMEPVKR